MSAPGCSGTEAQPPVRMLQGDETVNHFHSTHLLRLPFPIKEEIARCAQADGVSFDQFVATAVAEKIAAIDKAAFFAERRARADFEAFDRLMSRPGSTPLPLGDELP